MPPKSPARMARPVESVRSKRADLPPMVGAGQSSGFSAVSALPGATTRAVAAGAGGGAGTGGVGEGGAPDVGGGVRRCFAAGRKRFERIGDGERDPLEVLRRGGVAEGEAADRRIRDVVLLEPRIELMRPVLAGDDEKGVRLHRLVGDLAGRRFRAQPRVERGEVRLGARGEIELRAVFVDHELRRRADSRAGFCIGDRLEAGRRARLPARREQGLKLTGRERAVAGFLLTELESDDRIARPFAKIAVIRSVVEAEPDERVLRSLARRERQRQERSLLGGERRVGGGWRGRRRLGRLSLCREGEDRGRQKDGKAGRRSFHGLFPSGVFLTPRRMLEEEGSWRNSRSKGEEP